MRAAVIVRPANCLLSFSFSSLSPVSQALKDFMSKKQTPAYYQTTDGTYVALNGAARKLFKRKKIRYIDNRRRMNPKSIRDLLK
jgi:hypothetical protein